MMDSTTDLPIDPYIHTLHIRSLIAEFIGTFALVFVGCGAVISDNLTKGSVSHTGICLAFGLVVMVMILATGHISGAHFNPAVSIGFAAIGKFRWSHVPGYVLIQCLAAILASTTHRMMFGPIAKLGATLPHLPLAQTLTAEIVLTFFLMFVIAAVATDAHAEGTLAAIAIGGTVACCALFGGPISGASMNPARSLGPALLLGKLQGVWLYLVGPVLGAILGAWAYHLIREDRDQH